MDDANAVQVEEALILLVDMVSLGFDKEARNDVGLLIVVLGPLGGRSELICAYYHA